MIINRAFFGKNNCLKISLNNNRECFIHLGKKEEKKDKWEWKKIKMKDLELAEIILLIKGEKKSTSFYHQFQKDGEQSKTQIWLNKKGESLLIKIENQSKSLNRPEQEVLRIILEEIIREQNKKR